MTDDLEKYRKDARAWLESMAPKYGRDALRGLSDHDTLPFAREYMNAKYDAGYVGITWAKEHGGQGLSLLHKLAFEDEESEFGFPIGYFGISLGMPVPIMLKYRTDNEEKVKRAVAAMRGQEIWCQLFSEPAAGSDLAGLRTRAEREGDDWIINGQKLWTSYAQYSDYAVIVLRTDPTVAKHKGLTYFWIDMKAPGVEVRPVKLTDGSDHVNEVFFDNVRVSDSQRLGEVGGGFAVAMDTLVIERYSATDPAGFGPALGLFTEIARELDINDRPAIEDSRIRQQIARNYAQRAAMSAIYKRTIEALRSGMTPGPEGALHKLVSVRSRQKLSELAIDLKGTDAMSYDPHLAVKEDWTASWLSAATGRIAGGADEMLLNTIAERILGLPQDYRPDKSVPFNQIPQTGN